MPFKDPEKKREYHRLYMARKKLREMFEKDLLYNGENGRPLTEAQFEELLYDHELVWYGEKPFEFEYALKEAAAKIGVHPNTLRKWIKEGKVKYLQEAPHATIYIPEREIERLKDNSGFKSSK